MPDAAPVIVVGAGLAGLTCAASLTQQGIDVVVLERADEAGGTTVLSSGWAWRYVDAHTFYVCAPGGDVALQQLLLRDFDGAVEWLEATGVRMLARDTANHARPAYSSTRATASTRSLLP